MNTPGGEHSALIIGATGGIGASVSRKLASLGFRLFIHGRNAKKTADFARELKVIGGTQVGTIIQNLESRDDIESLIKKLTPHIPLIDVLVVSFGPMDEGPLGRASSATTERMFDFNLLLPVRLISAVAPVMAENHWGRIILFGGTGSDSNRAYRKIALYSAAKFGLNSIVRSAGAEFAGTGVTINAICPGYVQTEYYREKNLNNLKKKGKLLEPEKISDIIEFLTANSSAAINGSIINAGEGREW